MLPLPLALSFLSFMTVVSNREVMVFKGLFQSTNWGRDCPSILELSFPRMPVVLSSRDSQVSPSPENTLDPSSHSLAGHQP